MVRYLALLLVLVAACAPAPPPAPGPTGPGGFRDAAWTWRDESVYMIVTDRFRNGDPANDGDARLSDPRWWQGGDLQGVIDELDRIRALGLTAIWITPVVEQMPGGYHGYWTKDPYAIDPHLGDMAKLKELVAAAHAKGLKVVLDAVLNHLGPGHPWLEDPSKIGWFHPKCPVVFAAQQTVEDCWLYDLPDLNTEDPRVAAYLTEWSIWIGRESGVDAFRLDTARHLPTAFLRDWSAAVKRALPRLWILGEVLHRDYAYQRAYLDSGLDAVTDMLTYQSVTWAFAGQGDLASLRLPPAVAARTLGDRASDRVTFFDSHDVPRFVGATDVDAAAKARLVQALAYLYTAPGTPVLCYGTEAALPGAADPDNRRAMPREPLPNADVGRAVAALATARRDLAVLRRGSFETLLAEPARLAYARVLGGQTAIVVLNGEDTTRTISVPLGALRLAGAPARALLDGPSGTVRGGSLSIELPAHGAQVLVFGAAL